MTTLLKLFVTGGTPRANEAVRKTREILNHLTVDCHVDVVDILDDPAAAEQERIIATPTIIRVSPLPQRRVIGDVSDAHTLIDALGLPRRDGPGASGDREEVR